MRKLVIGLALAGLLVGPVLAQEGEVGEVIVTASRISEYDATETPHVVLRKRADNLLVEVNVVCDTRDASQRRAELKATFKNLIAAAAKDPSIELGLGEEVVGRIDETMIDTLIGPAGRPDTSQVTLLVKTRIVATDTLDSASKRIDDFIEKTAKAGRTEVLATNDVNLSLIRPEQYRGEVIALVAQDSLKTANAFGDGYGVMVSGLQLPISWYQSGPVELALYIPYRMEVRPR
jgi:hypothetical protein